MKKITTLILGFALLSQCFGQTTIYSPAITDATCNGYCDGVINFTAGGTGTLYYSVDGITYQLGSTFPNQCAGAYTIYAHDDVDTVSQVVTVYEPTLLTATTDNPTGLSCNGDCVAIATVAAAGGTGFLTYSWTSGGTGTFESNLCAGIHTVTVTDDNGCTASADVIITEPSALTFSVIPTDITCNGIADGTITFAASGGTPNYLYSINEGASFETIATYSGLSAGVRSVIVRDANGCESSSSTTINEPTLLTGAITAQTNILCHGDNAGTVTVAADAGSGKSPYLYSLDGGATTQASGTFNGLYAGSYPVTIVDDNGCTSDVPFTITESSLLSSHAGADTTVCEATSLTYGGSATGGSGEYFYTWDNGVSDGVAFNATVSTTYVLTTEDSYGCFATDTVVVTVQAPPIADAGLDHTVCENNVNVNLSGSVTNASGGMWEGGTGTFSPSSTDLNATYIPSAYDISSGPVLLILTTTGNGVCSAAVDSSKITINPAPSVAASNNDITCFGICDGNATVSATGGSGSYTYSWSSGGTASFETGLCAGTYTIAVSDANGCLIDTAVIINEPPLLETTGSSSNVVCHSDCDGSATATPSGGTGSYNYLWSTGSNGQTANGLCPGTYECIITDGNGCQDTSSATITEPPLLEIVGSFSNVVCHSDCDGSATATPSGGTGNINYLWSTSATSQNITGLCPGTYECMITDDNGCQDSITQVISEPAIISASSAVVTDASCTNTDGSITGITVSGGSGTYTYNYTGGTSNLDLLNAQPGSYILTITDTDGCAIETNAFVINSTISTITLSSATTSASCNGNCDGGISTVASGGDGNYSYTCSNGMAGGSLINVCAGTHTIWVIDGLGCQGVDTVTVLEPAVISNTISSVAPVCGSNDGSAEVTSTSGGVSPYTYQWSNGSVTALADSLLAGVYAVTVKDAALCTTIEIVNITSSTSPSITSTFISPTCSGGNNGSIDLTISGGTAPFSFDWSTGENTEDISNLAAGIYDVTIMDSSGCGIVETYTLTDVIAVDLSAVAITDASCGSADGIITVTASGGAGSYNYLWSSGGTGATEGGLAAGTYTLSVSDANGCLAMANYTISNASGPVIIVDQVIQPTCQGGIGEILVSVSGGVAPYSYSWSNGATSEDLFNAPVGSYELTVTDANGCQGVEYAELLGVNLNAAEICMVTVDTTTGSNIVVWTKEYNLGISEYEIYKETSSLNVFQLLGAVPFDSLTQFIDTAANSSVHSYRYKLRTIDSCSNESEFLAYHKTIHLVSNIGLSNVVNLVWDDYIGFAYATFYINRYHPSTGWEVIDSVAANVHSYTDNTYPSLAGLEYGIEVVPTSPCRAEKAQDHNTTRSNRATIAAPNGGPTVINENQIIDFTLFPNPTDGKFTLSFSGELSEVNVTVFDVQGKLITSFYIGNASGTKEFDISNYEKGMYLIQVSSEDHTRTIRLIKQ